MLRHLWMNVARTLVAPSSMCLAQYAAIAICFATCVLQFVSLLGTSPPVTQGLIAATALGLAAGSRRFSAESRTSIAGFSRTTLLSFGLAAWIVAAPWLVRLADWTIGQPGVIRLSSPGWNALALFGLALAGLGAPAFAAAHLTCSVGGRSKLPLVFLGAAVGLTIWGLGLAQILGPYFCGLVAAGASLTLAVAQSRQHKRGESRTPEAIAPVSPEEIPEGTEPATVWRGATEWVLALASGCWIAVIGRMTVQLSPGSVYIGCAEVIGLCVGLAIGTSLALRRKGRSSAGRFAVALGLALWGVGILAAFPLLIDGSLWINATVSSTTSLLVLRGAWAAVSVLPIGIATAVTLARPSGAPDGGMAPGVTGWLATAAAGYFVTAGAALQQFSPEFVIIGCAWLTLLAAVPAAIALRQHLLRGWPARLAATAAIAAVALAPRWQQHFDPVRSARLLFSSNVAYAFRAGLKPELLGAFDEGRHVATATGQRGIFTVWSYGGHQLQIRENGLPRGVISTDPEAFPRYAPETLQTLVPAVLHGNADRVLLLGLGSGESLTTALAFPTREVVCLETDPGLVRIVREFPSPDNERSLLDDERVRVSLCDPAIGIPALAGTFDVIVSSPENLSLAQAQPYVTTEFYRRAGRKLGTSGIFCQRLQHVDLGPRPIQGIVRSLHAAFRDVLAIEVAPCELLLCATNDPQGLIRPGLVARLEWPHVRAVLAESGLDWTLLLNVAAINREGLEEFCKTATGPLNTACEGRLPWALPRDMIRWAPKAEETRKLLGNTVGRLLNWVGDDASSPVVVRRLAEVQGQYELMTKYSDQYWAYRASLRDQVKEKPRSAIQLTGATDGEKTMHPEDRQRVAYFSALSRAIRTRSSTDIERLSSLATPYDPLITYFAHQEAAELCSRSGERDCALELRLRLYATFFSSPRDASLRNVIAALNLLYEQPDAEPDPATRWDDMNALLQVLKMRWQVRIESRPGNVKESIQEADQTMRVIEQTFRALETLTTAAGISESLWGARRAVLEKTLIAPMRAYQRELLRMAQRGEVQNDAAGDAATE